MSTDTDAGSGGVGQESPENALARALLSFHARMSLWEVDSPEQLAQPDPWAFAAEWLPVILSAEAHQVGAADNPHHALVTAVGAVLAIEGRISAPLSDAGRVRRLFERLHTAHRRARARLHAEREAERGELDWLHEPSPCSLCGFMWDGRTYHDCKGGTLRPHPDRAALPDLTP